MNRVEHGDCIDIMRTIPDNSIDSIVTDPPYGLGFMGKAWDALPPGLEWAVEARRVLKPGGHLLAFGGTRTWHRLAVAVEDAGMEIRDSVAWLYGSGFPKSLDVSKAIDKAAGAAPESPNAGKWNPQHNTGGGAATWGAVKAHDWDPATDAAKAWQGWGTALKPAFEPAILARKPLVGTVAANVLAHGVGALNIDGSRITSGRWPANVALDEDMAATFPESRFMYVAKAPKSERPVVDGVAHATVKPLALMRHLVKLVTPAGGLVLDPFAGSGTTAEAAVLEGFRFIAIEREAEYLPLIQARLDRANATEASK